MTTPTQYVAPSKFLAGKKLTFKVGDVIDPAALGMGAHPMHGALPVLTVTKVKDNGELLEGTITCQGKKKDAEGNEIPCGETVTVHLGDWFQKRRCETCQKRYARKNAKGVSPEVKAEREAKRAAEKAERDAKKAEEKTKKATERLEKQKKDLEEKLAKQKAETEEKLKKAEAEVARLKGDAPPAEPTDSREVQAA